MKRTTILTIAVAALLATGAGTSVFAFHSGGVGECIGCHSMHSDNDGQTLLQSDTKSGTCLTCHTNENSGFMPSNDPDGHHMVTGDGFLTTLPPGQRSPGGDFAWIKRDYAWSPPWGGSLSEDGDTHGHNILASVDFGYDADGENAESPGGDFDATKLACSSCHDPHGKYRRVANVDPVWDDEGLPIWSSGSYGADPIATIASVGSYRLLAGAGYDSEGEVTFTADPPAAIAPEDYNLKEDTIQVRMGYGKGMSAWCGQCHADMAATHGRVHRSDSGLGSDEIANYNDYVKTGTMTGAQDSSYLSLVPFGWDSADYAFLETQADSSAATYAGPLTDETGDEIVNCLSCHRAHASGFEYAMRWNPESEMLTYGNPALWPGTDNVAPSASPSQFSRGRTHAEMQAAYYDRPDATLVPGQGAAFFQRSLCNKCHAQD